MCKTNDWMGIALAVVVIFYKVVHHLNIDSFAIIVWKLLLQLLLHILLAC